jgi:hypothetical protein
MPKRQLLLQCVYNVVTIKCSTYIISTDEDPGLRIESFALINLRGVSTNKKCYIFYHHAIIQS